MEEGYIIIALPKVFRSVARRVSRETEFGSSCFTGERCGIASYSGEKRGYAVMVAVDRVNDTAA